VGYEGRTCVVQLLTLTCTCEFTSNAIGRDDSRLCVRAHRMVPVGKLLSQRRETRRFISKRRVLLCVVGCAALIWIGYSLIANQLVTRQDRRAPRDLETGILVGAEPRDLGPADARLAVLLVHGFVAGGNSFNDLPEHLAEQGWHVRVMLLPGHGTSPRDLENKSADDLVEAVLAELDILRARHERVALIGHSMGGALCTVVAAHAQVDALVLAAPYFRVTYRWYYLFPPETWATLARPVVRWLHKSNRFIQVNRDEVKDKIVSYRWTPLRGTRPLIEIGSRARSPQVLKTVTCPVLLLHSHLDNAASPKAAAEAFRSIGSSSKRVVWLETSNHILFWDRERDQVADEIVTFLASLQTR